MAHIFLCAGTFLGTFGSTYANFGLAGRSGGEVAALLLVLLLPMPLLAVAPAPQWVSFMG